MSSESSLRLPVINFSKQDLKPGTPEWDLVKVQVRQALQEYGCFEALFDKVLELRKAIFGALDELFDLPLETKKLYVSDKLYRGYYARSLQEGMAIDESNNVESIEQCLTNILWPHGNKSFSKTLLSFTELATGLEKTIKSMVFESFGLEKYMDEHMDLTNYILRVVKHEGPKISEPTVSIRPHHDQGFMTLLYQNEVNGWGIQTKGGEWMDVKPSQQSFIVLIGESFSAWLNGRLWVPSHRVLLSGNKERYCIGLFGTPRAGFKVKVPEELVDEENPMLFKPFDFEEYLGIHSAHIARGAIPPGVKDYCSV